MINTSAATTTQSSQRQLNSNISLLYQHFLAGDLDPLEFSERVDDLIGIHALIETADDLQLCA